MGICYRDLRSGAVIVLATPSSLTQAIIRGVGRSRIGIAISLAILAIAIATLYHLLRGIEIGGVIAAIETQPLLGIVIAGARSRRLCQSYLLRPVRVAHHRQE